MTSTVLLKIAFGILSVLCFSVTAYPCSCPGSPIKPTDTVRGQFQNIHIDKADIIFSGKVIRKDTYAVQFEVNSLWKGEVTDKFTMSTGTIKIDESTARGNSCSFNFATDNSYLVFTQYLDIKYTNGMKLLGSFLCGKTNHIQNTDQTISDLDKLRKAEKRDYRAGSLQTYVDLFPSTIDEVLTSFKRAHPNGSNIKFAEYANRQLIKRGLNYRFDICEMLPEGEPEVVPDSSIAKFKIPFTTADLKTQIFEIRSGFGDSPCGECFTEFPTARITRNEVVAVSNGKKIRLKRPKHFALDEVQLVDSSLKNVIRRWELPFSADPEGISLDGTKLYIGYYLPEIEESGLFLELSEDGTIRFAAKDSKNILDKSEDLEDFPKDDDNDYLGYKKFTRGGKTYFVKFSFPCT